MDASEFVLQEPPKNAASLAATSSPVPKPPGLSVDVLPRRSRRAGYLPLPLVGRREELSRLDRALERAALGHGSVWSITGPAGIGKTRLMVELSRIAVRRGFDVRSSFSTWEGQTPLLPFLRMIGGTPEDPGTSEPVVDVGGRILPRIALGLDSSTGGLRRRRNPDQMAIELLGAFGDATRLSPVLLLVDDFHRSDPDSVRFLRLLAGLTANRRLLLVFSFREESVRNRAPGTTGLADLLEELRIAGPLESVELRGLTDSEMMQFAGSLLPRGWASRRSNQLHVAELVRVAGGNPFFLRELLAFGVGSGTSEVKGAASGTARVGAPTEETVNSSYGPLERLLRRRLDALPRRDRQVLGAAALIGDSFSEEEVAAAVPESEESVYEPLQRMGSEGWPVRWVEGRKGRLAFLHSLLRQACGDLLLPSERRRFAGRLARWWSRNHPEDLESTARFCAEAGRGGHGRLAVDRLIEEALQARSFSSLERYLLWRARIVGSSPRAWREHLARFFSSLDRMRVHEPLELSRLCRRFLELHPPEPERSMVEAWEVGCVAYENPPSSPVQLERLRRRIASDPRLARSPPVAIQLELARLRVAASRGEWERVRSVAKSLYRLTRPRGPSFELFVAAQHSALSSHRLGRYREAMRWLGIARAECHRARLEETTPALGLSTIRASVEYSLDHCAKAAEIEESVARRYTELGSFRRAVAAWFNVGAARMGLSDLGAARRAHYEALTLIRQVGLGPQEGQCYTNLGLSFLEEGRTQEATRYFRRALPLLKKATHPDDYVIMVRIGLGRIALAQGRPGEAADELHLAEELCRGTAVRMTPEVERSRAVWLASTGNRPAAIDLLRRSLARRSPRLVGVGRRDTLSLLTKLQEGEEDFSLRGEAVPLEHDGGERSVLVPPAAGGVMGPPRTDPIGAGRSARSASSSGGSHGEQFEVMGSASERVLEALYRAGAVVGGPMDRDVVPLAFTQVGLSSDLGVPQSSFARGLLRLVERGALLQSRRRVEGATRSLKAYLLTARGLELARPLT